ncbi:MAG TPA: hypothetical protein VFI82_02145 [Terriglobales bacterium]|nr:hypothetical protein [Terriglobales bacterium]
MENEQKVYITKAGLPLRIELDWPFHRSQSGADFYVLHGTVTLENSGGLHALVALQLTVTVREVLPSLEAKDVETPAINTVRKAVDRKEIEFQKTPKRVPVPFGSRSYDFKRQQWAFGDVTDEERAALLLRKIYWSTKLGAPRVLIGEATDAQYLDTTPEHLLAMAGALPELRVSGEYAVAAAELMGRGGEIEEQARVAREELEKKHAFERG